MEMRRPTAGNPEAIAFIPIVGRLTTEVEKPVAPGMPKKWRFIVNLSYESRAVRLGREVPVSSNSYTEKEVMEVAEWMSVSK